MSSQSQPPLVGPVKRRGVREMLRLTPLAELPHTALVITRRGGLIGVIPAGGRRTLSDYFDLPCEVREVDMRERPLVIARRCDSAEPGHTFTVTLQIAYQVARPEHVALAHVDVIAELEEAIDQRARAVAATLTVEQASALKAYLVEALVTGNELPQRFDELGLTLRRVDVAVELDEGERVYAEAVRDQTRDRPLLARFRVENRDSESPFDTQVGGFYRLASRNTDVGYTSAEEIIYDIVAAALARVGVSYGPEQYTEAARAMTEHLWTDGVLKAELARSGIELLRPAVHIYPDRALLEHMGRPLMLEDGRRREPRVRRMTSSPRLLALPPHDPDEPAALEMPPAWQASDAEVVDAEVVADSANSWISEWRSQQVDESEEVSYSVADDVVEDATAAVDETLSWSFGDAPAASAPEATEVEAPAAEVVAEAPAAEVVAEAPAAEVVAEAPAAEVVADAPEVEAPEAEVVVEASEAEAPAAEVVAEAPDVEGVAIEPIGWADGNDEDDDFAAEELLGLRRHDEGANPDSDVAAPAPEPTLDLPAESEAEPVAPAMAAAPVVEPAASVDQSRVDQLVQLLLGGGPALYKLWSLEIRESPERLPEIIKMLTADSSLTGDARSAAVQQAVIVAIQGQGQRPASAPTPASRLPEAEADDDVPDWMKLRETTMIPSADITSERRRGGI